ncbi:MAG: F0F1 ATP synthase subunit epsilon [Clostridiales bacterium]|nr:F0F1 ATP synthase subunit epsilon [Clostridiales bacterium]
MSNFVLTVSTPDGDKFKGEVTRLIVRGSEGDLAVMAGHIPFATAVLNCTVRIDLPDGTTRSAETESGILTVGREEVVLLSSGIEDLK